MTLIELYSHKMNLDVLIVITSYPQLEISHNAEWMHLNWDFRYDVTLAISVSASRFDAKLPLEMVMPGCAGNAAVF